MFKVTRNYLVKLSVVLILAMFLLFSVLYFFNLSNNLSVYFGVADGYGILNDILFNEKLTSHLKIIISLINQFAPIHISVYLYNIAFLLCFLAILYRFFRERNYDVFAYLLFLILFLTNQYVFSYFHEIDKPIYVALALYCSLFSFDIYLKKKGLQRMLLFPLYGLIGLFTYISYVFFIPLYLLIYLINSKLTWKVVGKYMGSAIFLGLIGMLVGYNFSPTVAHSIDGILSVTLGGDFGNMTGFSFLGIIFSKGSIMMWILALLMSIALYTECRREYIWIPIAGLYAIFLFSIQSISYSNGSRYPFYVMIPFFLRFSLSVYTIFRGKWMRLVIFSLLLGITVNLLLPFSTYFRNLWQPHFALCNVLQHSMMLRNKSIAFLERPSIAYNCGIRKVEQGVGKDEFGNKYFNYGWDINNTDRVRLGIKQNFYDVVVVDYRGKDYIDSASLIETSIDKSVYHESLYMDLRLYGIRIYEK